MTHESRRLVTRSVLVAALAVLSGHAAVDAEANDPIRIAENDWTGNLVTINLAKNVLEHEGYEVELVFADYTAQWAGLAAGDLDVAMEIWPSFSVAAHDEWIDEKGAVEVIGELGVVGKSGWYVPTYVIEGDAERGIEPMAPDLRTWEDVNRYAELFARPETGDKGFCIDAVQSWEIHNEERLANLGVNLVNVYAGTEGALVAEIESAYAKGEPLFICDMWTPHWVQAVYDLTEIMLPPYTDACYGVGTEEPATYACDWPSDVTYNVARVGFRDENPRAYEVLQAMHLATEEQQKMLVLVDIDGHSVEDAVAMWMEANQDTWMSWLQ